MQLNADEATADQQAKWDNSAASYSDVLISKGISEPNSRQVVQVVQTFLKESQAGDVTILDLASNAGNPALPLATAVPHAKIIATDLAPATVGLLQKRAAAEGVTNVSAQPADAQNLHQFKNSSFLVVTCSYGLMFMPEHQKALREAYRVLKPGGMFIATVWAPLETFQFAQCFTQVMRRVAGDQAPPPSPLTPWRFGNPLELLQDLKAAGFSHVQCSSYNHPMSWPLEDLFEFQIGPHGQSRPTLDKLKAAGRQNVDAEAKQVMINVLKEQGRLQGNVAKFDSNIALLFTALKQ